jgi:hypothetical protein
MNYNRIRTSPSHTFTWIGFEKVDSKDAYMTAMVPRRVPKFETKEITLEDGTKMET